MRARQHIRVANPVVPSNWAPNGTTDGQSLDFPKHGHEPKRQGEAPAALSRHMRIQKREVKPRRRTATAKTTQRILDLDVPGQIQLELFAAAFTASSLPGESSPDFVPIDIPGVASAEQGNRLETDNSRKRMTITTEPDDGMGYAAVHAETAELNVTESELHGCIRQPRQHRSLETEIGESGWDEYDAFLVSVTATDQAKSSDVTPLTQPADSIDFSGTCTTYQPSKQAAVDRRKPRVLTGPRGFLALATLGAVLLWVACQYR